MVISGKAALYFKKEVVGRLSFVFSRFFDQ